MQADIRPTVLAPVSTTLAISYRRLQRHRRLFIAGVIGNGEQLIAGVVDASDEHKFGNMSANFRKNLTRPH